MPDKQKPFQALEVFLPPNTLDKVAEYMRRYPMHLSIKRERKTLMGDYRPPATPHARHRISVNGNLNPYAFLVTLLHELAHLYNFVNHQHRVKSHGAEWKAEFKALLSEFLKENIFPNDLKAALIQYFNNIKASTCTDTNLYKALKKYDKVQDDTMLVEDVPIGKIFKTKDGRAFQKIEKLRTRYKCKCVATELIYFVPGIMEVKLA